MLGDGLRLYGLLVPLGLRTAFFPLTIMPSFRNQSHVSGALQGVVIFGAAIVATFGGMTCTAVAGDLLRGGYTNSQSGSAMPGSFTPPSVIQARKNAQDVLARTTLAMQSLNAMQSAARKLAQASAANNLGVNPNAPGQTLPNVPNGLGAGGLDPVGGATPLTTGPGYQLPATWTGVGSLTQTTANTETTVTVNQNKPDAILYWNTFNIGKDTDLDFNQSKTGASANTSIAFNIVEGNSINPSQILGNLNAQGQVYVINQNGIIFGGASQVNVHTLVASSLPIDTYLIGNGLLNNPDDQFLFSVIAQPAGINGSPAFTPPSYHTGADGDVIVDPGAKITSPADAANVGGRVALIGPSVDNEGTISTPDGQTILAAGLQAGFVASSAATLRGLDVYIGAVTDAANPTAGTATNGGVILAQQGDAYMVGPNVDQMGAIYTTTSVTLNGEVDLLAQYNSKSSGGLTGVAPFLPTSSGAVVMGADSVTSIVPEWNSSDTINIAGFTLSSLVNVQGKTIHMVGDATLLAPSATVNLDAGTWLYQVLGSNPSSTFINAGGQIYLDSGAVIDAAGSTDVNASVDQNIISVQLLGPELADSPSQRAGVLAGQTIYVDIRDSGNYNGETWVGTPLVDDVSSFVNLVQYTVGELTINGGVVNLSAGDSVVMQKGSEVNVSGGWIDYEGGVVQTSEVISGGNIFPINQAYPDLVYQGFNLGTFTVDHPSYGVSATYTDPILDLSHYESSYVSGGNGGSVSVTAPSVALDGQLLGNTVAGPRQQAINSATPNSLDATSMPSASSLQIAFEAQEANATFDDYSPTPPTVTFTTADNLPAASPFSVDSNGDPAALSTARQDQVDLSPDLFTTDGFGAFKLNDGNGNVIIPGGVTLALSPGGAASLTGAAAAGISIAAANLTIDGSITDPDGKLAFTVYDYSPFAADAPVSQPPINAARGHFILGSGATLSTAGLIVDDRDGVADADVTPQVDNGGSISINSYDTDLMAGSIIDVSGGVIAGAKGAPSYGNAGSITISGGQDPGQSSILNGSLVLGAQLEGYSGAKGGNLSITAQLVQVGGNAGAAYTQVFAPSFFDDGGFANIALAGVGGLTIEPGTKIDPVITSLVEVPSTPDGGISLAQAVLPVGERDPVSLSFKASVTNAYDGTLLYPGIVLLGQGASIETDPGATVSLTGGGVAVLGSIVAPAGTINITGALNSSGPYPLASEQEQVPTVDLGPQSDLSTAGVTVITPNAYGYRTGNVLNGGTINVSGNIVAEAGSVIDVSGASDTLDRTPVQANVDATTGGNYGQLQDGSFLGMELAPTEVDSSGGLIDLHGYYELFDDATLLGSAGGASATGGSLIISAGVGLTNNAQDINLVVTQNTPAIPRSFYGPGQDGLGHPILGKNGLPITAPMGDTGLYVGGYVAVDTFGGGGFNSVDLAGTVDFSGAVSISVPGSLTVATGGVIYANSAVHLNASYIALGLPFEGPIDDQLPVVSPFKTVGANPIPNFAPTYGTGDLTVTANLIDIGNLSLQDIGKANFIADNGDIRGDGTLDVAGSIYMQAGQIYPATETVFTIAAYDYNDGSGTQAGSVTIKGSGQRDLPLSAGGTLNIYATDITQDGVLRAPLGAINIGWNGTGTAPVDLITGKAVDASQTITLGAGSTTSVSAVDPITGQALEIPYGSNPEGTSWIDPSGVDITTGGVPQKSISISGVNVNDEHGAVIDIKGGGDLLAYQFVPGIGGNNDTLASTSSFAIVPGYQADYAPYDVVSGYNNASLVPGDRVYLNASNGLPAGVYTLLPARYALLPGAFLVTPQGGLPAGMSVTLPDGGALVSGYQMKAGETAAPETTSFEVDSSAVVKTMADYTVYSGNSFLTKGALLNNQAVPRLPQDSGELSFQAIDSLQISGAVESTPDGNGLGGLVDIASPNNIVIAAPGVTQSGALVLDASELNSFGAASLLIGGTRETGAAGVTVNVTTSDITVENAGSPLIGTDIILAANNTVTLDSGAEIESSGPATGAEGITVNGDGALVRVSADPGATVERTGVTGASTGQLNIASGVTLKGGAITLDSAHGTSLDPSAVIEAKSIALNSGQITIALTNPGAIAPTTGLVLSGNALQGLFGSADSLSLLSYSSIDIYGTGSIGAVSASGLAQLKNLTLSAGEINGFNSTGGTVEVAAQNVLLENAANAAGSSTATSAAAGTLTVDANTIRLGSYTMAVNQFTNVNLNASNGILATAPAVAVTGAASIVPGFTAQGDLTITTPMITGMAGASESVAATTYSGGPGGASGDLVIATPTTTPTGTVTGGLGASLTFTGATGLTDNSSITAHSGSITLQAAAGDVTIGNAGSVLDVSGQSKTFFDVTKYTNGGEVNLIADQGNVVVDANSSINVAAQAGGGNAGTLSIQALNPANLANNGGVTLLGTLAGQGGAGGHSGSFSLVVGSLPTLSTIDAALNTGDFDETRSIEVQTGDVTVDGLATAANFNLSADAGSITVTGEINASDVLTANALGQVVSTGGAITLQAAGSVTLADNSILTVAAGDVTGAGGVTIPGSYTNAGRGGSVSLEAGSDVNGVASSTGYVNIEAGSTIDLSVAATPVQGDLGGSLLLRAPQTGSQSSPTGIQIGTIDGTIIGSTSTVAPTIITAEGYAIFNAGADGSGGIIDNEEGNVATNGAAFTNLTSSITASLLSGNSALASSISGGATQLIVEPGAEIINNNASVNGGSLTLDNTWDLSADRFGANNVAGDLTLRASGNIVFNFGASLSDGFDAALASDGLLWDAPLLPTVGAPSWSYRIVAGANFNDANFAGLAPLASLPAGSGSVLVGYGSPGLPTDQDDSRSDILPVYFQTIRTGAGSIQIYAADDVQLLDNLATIYSAGTQAPALANFTLPNLNYNSGLLGSPQNPFYAAQYTEYGGNVTIAAQDDIAHYVNDGSGLVADSSLELPDNWLYRQGAINAKTGQFSTSTSWWTDFSNFVEGVGAFGGGNVTLNAGNDISNVDAVVPTNARMPSGTPDLANLVELGGGNLSISAGHNIDGGVYYVESGQGSIAAGGGIITNATRATVDEGAQQFDQSTGATPDPSTWLPTTLFAGQASFDISAGGSILLGSVVNPFLLPQGINNSYRNRTYFSTFAASDAVNVESLAGGITIKDSSDGGGDGSLAQFLVTIDSQDDDPNSYSAGSEPWLSLAESTVSSFTTVAGLMPPSLTVTAFSGSINLVGTITLAPSANGSLELFAGDSVNALQINGIDGNTGLPEWGTAVIDLSDANPASIPGITSPLGGATTQLAQANLDEINALFAETGSTEGAAGVIQTKEALHDPGLLHKDDTTPAYIYAADGDISGLTLFSSKFTDVIASQDITDASFCIQNVNASQISIVSAGDELIPYDPNSPLRIEAHSAGNELIAGQQSEAGTGTPTAGDIQINGPGTLEVLAGRDLTLGSGENNTDGTAVGITSIGNARNPYLPDTGAQIVIGAGLGSVADGLQNSSLDISAFVTEALDGVDGAAYFSDLAQTEPGLDVASLEDFKKLSSGQQAIAALDLFYLVLRDTGRDHNLVGNAGYGNYAAGMSAIAALLPKLGAGTGDIDVTSKEITTVNGGDIDIVDPSGQLTVGVNLAGAQPVEQGIFTDNGGNISVFTQGSVNLGTSRVFTLHGGNIIIWSSQGNIDAGNSSKTVATAPPTVVLVDPQSADVEIDLAGLATGGGIGVLATVAGVPPGNVDLIAPTGVIDAGDAGIRATGNLNLAAVQVLNASNIQAGGSTSGAPTVTVAAPNLAGLSAASSAAGAANAASDQQTNSQDQQSQSQDADSVITVSVVGYGGGDDSGDAGG
jgi:filamentous hemagglutinin family protein